MPQQGHGLSLWDRVSSIIMALIFATVMPFIFFAFAIDAVIAGITACHLRWSELASAWLDMFHTGPLSLFAMLAEHPSTATTSPSASHSTNTLTGPISPRIAPAVVSLDIVGVLRLLQALPLCAVDVRPCQTSHGLCLRFLINVKCPAVPAAKRASRRAPQSLRPNPPSSVTSTWWPGSPAQITVGRRPRVRDLKCSATPCSKAPFLISFPPYKLASTWATLSMSASVSQVRDMCRAIVPYQERTSRLTGHDAVTDWASSSSPPKADNETFPESLFVVAGAARQPVRAYETFERRDHRTPRYANGEGGAATPRSYVDLGGCARARVLKIEVRVYSVLEPDVNFSLHDYGRGNVPLTQAESQQLKAAAAELRCAMDQRRMILRAAHTELDRQTDLVRRCEREAERLDKLYGEVEELERRGMEEEDSRPMVDALGEVGGRDTGCNTASSTTSTATTNSSSSSSNNNNNNNKANSYHKYYKYNDVDNKSHDDNNNSTTSANDAGDDPFIRWGTYAGRVFAVKVAAPLAFTYSSGACSISVLDAAMDAGEVSCEKIVRLACQTAAQEAALHRYNGLLEEEHAKPVFEQTQKVEADLKRLKALTDKMYTKIAKITVAFKWRMRSLMARQRICGTAHTNVPLHSGRSHEGATVQPEVPSQSSRHVSAATEHEGRYVQKPSPSRHTSGTSDLDKSTPAPTPSTQAEANSPVRLTSTTSVIDASGSSTGLTSGQKEDQHKAAGEEAAAMEGRRHSDQNVGEEIVADLDGGCTVHDAADMRRESSQNAQHEIEGHESKSTSTPLIAVDTSAATCLAHMGKRFFALLFRGRGA